jgi:hypothetical protein
MHSSCEWATGQTTGGSLRQLNLFTIFQSVIYCALEIRFVISVSGEQMNPSPYPATFTSAHGRARVVKILLIIGALVTAMSLVVEVLSLAFPPLTDDQEFGDNPVGAAVSLVMFLLAIPEIIIYLATIVFFLMWLYRAYGNLKAFDPWCRLEYSRGLTIGSFFIPFANLVIPYRAVKQVWQKSGAPDEALLAEPNAPASFPIWWMFWLLATFAGNLSFRLSFRENVPESTVTMISIVASALSCVAAVFAYLVVDAIDKRQEETAARLGLGKLSGPPPPPRDF